MTKKINEDGGAAGGLGGGPLNNTGSGTDGAVAGLGGKDGEPGVSKKKKSPILANLRRKAPVTVGLKEAPEEGIWGGRTTFIVEKDEFVRLIDLKQAGTRLTAMDLHEDILKFANKNRGTAVVIQNKDTKAVCFLRH